MQQSWPQVTCDVACGMITPAKQSESGNWKLGAPCPGGLNASWAPIAAATAPNSSEDGAELQRALVCSAGVPGLIFHHSGHLARLTLHQIELDDHRIYVQTSK